MSYFYNNIIISPNLDGIHSDVVISEMINKYILWCRWDQDIEELKIEFDTTLSSSDKNLLDNIVENNL
jgi:hypothetical protein